MHGVLKFLCLEFNIEILIIEVEALLNQSFMALQNLRGGKGNKMFQFSEEFERTGKYKGVELNRARHQTRSQVQARMDQFVAKNIEENECTSSQLFNSFNGYVNFVIAALKERFAPISKEPISLFRIFDFQLWPEESSQEFLL